MQQEKAIKIGVLGTHGIGKTTFALDLAQLMQKTGRFSVTVLTELARECPYPLGVNQPVEATNWLISRQISRELELQRNASIVICDRTSVDALVYTNASGNIHDREKLIEQGAIHWLKTYDLLVWIRPGDEIVDDGFRMLDHEFRTQVDQGFEEFMESLNNVFQIRQESLMNPQIRHEFFIKVISDVDCLIKRAAKQKEPELAGV